MFYLLSRFLKRFHLVLFCYNASGMGAGLVKCLTREIRLLQPQQINRIRSLEVQFQICRTRDWERQLILVASLVLFEIYFWRAAGVKTMEQFRFRSCLWLERLALPILGSKWFNSCLFFFQSRPKSFSTQPQFRASRDPTSCGWGEEVSNLSRN